MEITLSRMQLSQMLADAAEIGANKALTNAGIIKGWLTKEEAKRRYGVTAVNKWLKEGVLKMHLPTQSSIKRRIKLEEIEAINKALGTPIYNMIGYEKHKG